ncbi:hypothetical protein UG55_101155 [Frankia sp. EI5c]|uniref:hypothetical protein n=1 Tax=Frankia sp. EI5c TaxID=683316 RepID=UPI0007C38BCA|nr:hypothetical protein [Frankia sp. EI5c]OAA26875.1 hypothetical protein UG55_101155 [Frankia sp. EI5c]
MTEPAPSSLDEALSLLLGVPSEPGRADLLRVFGPGPGVAGYRRLARLVHPDRVPAARSGVATAAFLRLSDLWGRYQRGQDAPPVAPAAGGETVIRTRRHIHTLLAARRGSGAEARDRPAGGVVEGDVALLHPAECRPVAGGEAQGAFLKIPRSAADNDLMEREAAALQRLARVGDQRFAAYVPRLVESFPHAPAGAVAGRASAPARRVNVIGRLDGFLSLARVRAAHPRGVDARDVAWMWRRLLVALGYAHRAGVLHGAVVPGHVLVHPEQHGLVLVDWCYSGTPGESLIPALVPGFEAMYPPEVPARRPPDESTDIYLATRCMTYLLGPDTPAQLRRFADGCTLPSAARRPHDAWRLLAELDEVLERLFGPRRFRQFRMPPVGV